MPRKLRKLIFANAHLKLISVAIATAIWLDANNRLREEVSVSVPLVVRVPEGYQIVHQSHTKVQMRLKGPHYLMRRRQDEAALDFLRLTAVLKPEDFPQGVARLKVDPAWLNVPERELVQTSVTGLQPKTVTVYVSKVVTRPVPVAAQLTEAPHPGYEVRGWTAVPAEVLVTGPALVVNRLESIKTHKISVWDAQADLRRVVPLVLEETVELEGRLQVTVPLQAEPPRVAVRVRIGGEKGSVELKDIPVLLLKPPGFPYRALIEPEEQTVSVVISGLPQDVARLDKGSVTAYVDLRGLQEVQFETDRARYKERVRLLMPEDIPVTPGTPEPAQVTVVLEKTAPQEGT